MSRTCVIVLIGATILRCQAASDTCSGGKEWQQCATACPLTCDNYDTAAFVCTESCIEGCACPEGKVELDGVCVEPSTCARCSQCVEGQRCSAVLSADCENLICKDPIAVPCSPDVPLTCPTNARCLTHNTTGTSFCLESCFMQNGGCSSDQTCHSVRTQEPCNPLLQSCFTISCNETQSDEGVCPIGWELNECGSLCQRTCEDYLTNSHKDCSDDTCAMPACVCPEGLVEYEDRCVDPLECHSLIYRKVLESFSSQFLVAFGGNYAASETLRLFEELKMHQRNLKTRIGTFTQDTVYCTDTTICGYITYVSLTTGCHTLYHRDDEAHIGVSAYGFSSYNSYGYPGGLQIKPAQYAVVGWEKMLYHAYEDDGVVEVCAIVYTADNVECPIPHPFDVIMMISGPTTVSSMMRFGVCEKHRCMNVSIVNYTHEGKESISISLQRTSDLDSRIILAPVDARITIIDNVCKVPVPVVGLENTPYEVSEDVGMIEVCAKVTAPEIACPFNFSFYILLYTRDNSAEGVNNYDSVLGLDLMVFEECQLRSCVNATIRDDTIVERDEEVLFSLEEVIMNEQNITLEPAEALVMIVDDDVAVVRMIQTDYIVSEDETDVTVCAVVETSSGPAYCPVGFEFNISLSTVGQTAESNRDFDPVNVIETVEPCQQLTCVTVTIVNDQTVEEDEYFIVELDSLHPRIKLVEDPRANVLIWDFYDRAQFGLKSTYCAVREDETDVEVCVELKSPPNDCPVAFPFTLTLILINITATFPDDYTNNSTDLIFGPCDDEQCVILRIIDDNTPEQWEMFNISLQRPPGLTESIELVNTTKKVTIIDNDLTLVGFSRSPLAIEDSGRVRVCLNVKSPANSCPAAVPFELLLITEPDTATPNVDYIPVTQVLTFLQCSREVCVDIPLVDDEVLEDVERFIVFVTNPPGVNDGIELEETERFYSIIDVDDAMIEFESLYYEVEEGSVLEVCAVVTQPDVFCGISFEFDIDVVFSSHSAAHHADYEAETTTLHFNLCKTRKCVHIPTVDDCNLEERGELFEVELRRTRELNRRIRLTTTSAVVNITDNDVILVGLEETLEAAQEGEHVEVCVVFNNKECYSTFPFGIRFQTLGNSAVPNEDYVPVNTIVRFSPQQSERCVYVTIINDTQVEQEELFGVSVAPIPGLDSRILFQQDTGEVVINDDKVLVGFVAMAYIAGEGDDTVLVCVEVKASECIVNFAFSIEFMTTGGTAVATEDYIAQRTTLTFTPCEHVKCVEVSLVDDSVLEDTESFRILLSTNASSRISIESQAGEITITDDDVVVVDIEYSSYETTEGDGTVTVCTVVSFPSGIVCPVDFSFTVDLIVEDDNYPIVFSPCATRACTFVPVMDDGVVERSKTVLILLERPEDLDNGITIGNGAADLRIIDDPNDVAEVVFERIYYQFSEESEANTVCVRVYTPSVDCPIDFPFSVMLSSVDRSAESTSDYTTVSRVAIFQQCETLVCEQINITDDLNLELTETFIIGLHRTPTLDPRIRLNPVNTVVEIQDNDGAVVGLANTSLTVSEDPVYMGGYWRYRHYWRHVEVCLRVISPSIFCPVMFTFSVILTTIPGTAVSGADFELGNSATSVRFYACQDISCVRIQIVNDEELEDTESFSISLLRNEAEEVNITVDSSTGVVEIIDDDVAMVGFEDTVYRVDEDVNMTHMCIGVMGSRSASCVIPFPITLAISTSNGAAISPDDYGAISKEIMIAPCQPRVCVDVSIVDDAVVENDEILSMSLSSPSDLDSRIILFPNRSQVIINDNDAINIRLENATYHVKEDIGLFQVCAFLRYRHTLDYCPINIQATLSSHNGTAVAGYDYGHISTILHFLRCQTVSCTNVSIVDDVRMEALRETFTLVLENTDQDSRISVSTQPSTVHIEDDDGVEIDFDRSYEVTESDGSMVYVCTVLISPVISCAIQTPIAVNFSTYDNLADSPSDYVSLPLTTVTFNPCDTRQCVNITINDDMDVEYYHEWFLVHVRLIRTTDIGSRVELLSDIIFVDIIDTDVAIIAVESAIFNVSEDVGSVDVCLVVDCHIKLIFAVTFSVSGTADDQDFTGVPITIEFPPCEWSSRWCVPVFILEDLIVENNESLTVTVSSVEPADKISFGSEATEILINDNDAAVVRLKRLHMFACEGDGMVEVCAIVKDQKSITFSFDVTFVFVDDSATHPDDFLNSSADVTFAPGTSEACTTVVLVDSVDLEMPESFTVTLQLTDTALDDHIVLIEDYNEGKVKIIDNDEAVIGLEHRGYQLFSGDNSVEVCVYVSKPTPDISTCPITFPFNVILRLSNPSQDYFVVDETQPGSPRPEGGIDRESGEVRDVTLNFNSCQRKMCFDVTLREGVNRPEPGRYSIRVARAPDYNRGIVLDPYKTSGFIEIQNLML